MEEFMAVNKLHCMAHKVFMLAWKTDFVLNVKNFIRTRKLTLKGRFDEAEIAAKFGL